MKTLLLKGNEIYLKGFEEGWIKAIESFKQHISNYEEWEKSDKEGEK